MKRFTSLLKYDKITLLLVCVVVLTWSVCWAVIFENIAFLMTPFVPYDLTIAVGAILLVLFIFVFFRWLLHESD